MAGKKLHLHDIPIASVKHQITVQLDDASKIGSDHLKPVVNRNLRKSTLVRFAHLIR